MSAPAPGNGGRRPLRLTDPRVLAALVVLTCACLALAWWARGRGGGRSDFAAEGAGAPTAAVDLPTASDRAVVLVFPRRDGDGWVNENRRLTGSGQPGADLQALMQALCDGPRTGRAVSALPRGTRSLAAFVDPAKGTAVLDFSRELVASHPGGSAAETATLLSILRTVAVNFPQVGACTILVDGRPVGTLAGHLDLSHPFTPRRWL